MEGVDYAGDRPSSTCLRQAGKHFVGRYFGPGGSWKHATRRECDAHRAAGLTIVSLVEGFADDPLRGYQYGMAHAIAGSAAARAAGMAASRPLYFAVDFDMRTSQRGRVADYLKGAASSVGVARVGVYGGYDTVKWAMEAGLARWSFQTYAWSGGRWYTGNHFEQYSNHRTVCGATVDLCRSKRTDFGQWPAPSQTIGDAPAPPPPSTVDVGWDYTTHVDALATAMGDLGNVVGGAARSIDNL